MTTEDIAKIADTFRGFKDWGRLDLKTDKKLSSVLRETQSSDIKKCTAKMKNYHYWNEKLIGCKTS